MFDWTVETPISQVIGEAIGAGSMCWEHPENAGVFQVDQANKIVDEVLEIIRIKSMRIG